MIDPPEELTLLDALEPPAELDALVLERARHLLQAHSARVERAPMFSVLRFGEARLLLLLRRALR